MTDYTGHVSQKCQLIKTKCHIFNCTTHRTTASVTVTFKATTQTVIVQLFHYMSVYVYKSADCIHSVSAIIH